MRVIRLLALICALSLLIPVGCRGKSSENGAADGAKGAGDAPGMPLPPPPLPEHSRAAMTPDDVGGLDAMNDAVGVMGMFRYDEAAAAFGKLAREYPQWLDAQVNHAIAVLNRQGEGDEQAALERLNAVIATDGSHLRARYTAAVLLRRAGRADEAREHFQFVVDQDPDDPFALYFLGQSIAGDDPRRAIELFDRAIAINPYLRSPYYAAFQVLMRQGETERAAEYQASFERLQNNPLASVIREVYTRMGPKAEAQVDGSVVLASRAAAPASGEITFGPLDVLMPDQLDVEWRAPSDGRPASITAADIDEDGDIDLFIADVITEPDSAVNAVIVNEGAGAFRLDLGHKLARVSDVNAAAWGDFDNDEIIDVYLLRRGSNQLWRQASVGRWEDVTVSTGTGGGELDTVDGLLVDADHDGDLDIFCVNADGPNELLNNNLDGTFTAIGAQQGIAGDGRPSRQALFADLDLDRDADLIVINENPPHEVYLNDRLWNYHAAEGFDDFKQSAIAALVEGDLNADGFPNLHALAPDGSITTWTRGIEGAWATGAQPGAAYGEQVGARLAVADIRGVGTLSLVRGTPGNDPGYVGWALVQLGAGRGPSMVALAPGSEPAVWFGSRGYLTLELRGVEDGTSGPPPARTNRSGIGARVAARTGSRWTVMSTFRADSGPGQGVQPVAIGMGEAEHLDYVSIDWPDGVFQSEVHGQSPLGDAPERDLSVGAHAVIGELQRIKSSCPVLFAWNGHEFEFVSDLLGVGGIGYMVAPGEYAPPRPWENFLLPAGLLQPRDGRYALKLGEPMEEACYLDAVALAAYDLPPGWSMTLDERMNIAGPEPTGEPRFYRRDLTAASAVNERGEDVMAAIGRADQIAAPVGELDARFLGRLDGEHVLTLEFDEAIASVDGTGEPMLVIDGWVEYPYSQTMFAAWQAGAAYEAPTLEARDSAGHWHTLMEQFGYPAGMPRQMSVPLDGLPAGCDALRLRTNQEIYWDRIAVAWAEPSPQVVVHELALERADLRQSGFALRTTGRQRLPHYDYAARPPLADSRFMPGRYTRFGSVEDLIGTADGVPVVFGPGEETHFETAVPAVTPPEGWTRRFVLTTVGWCKDMDLYTQTGQTVDPIPGDRSSADREALLDGTRTRFDGGD